MRELARATAELVALALFSAGIVGLLAVAFMPL